ncbi:MAG: hypothetical protein H6643_02970 [Caldilineaceae bacterium]|nr:hypothetical protein [Caldilineaceae bacterium]
MTAGRPAVATLDEMFGLLLVDYLTATSTSQGPRRSADDAVAPLAGARAMSSSKGAAEARAHTVTSVDAARGCAGSGRWHA